MHTHLPPGWVCVTGCTLIYPRLCVCVTGCTLIYPRLCVLQDAHSFTPGCVLQDAHSFTPGCVCVTGCTLIYPRLCVCYRILLLHHGYPQTRCVLQDTHSFTPRLGVCYRIDIISFRRFDMCYKIPSVTLGGNMFHDIILYCCHWTAMGGGGCRYKYSDLN